MELNNMDDLRDVLITQIKKLDDKSTTPAVANAIFNGVGKILSTVKLEIEHSRYVRKLDGALPLRVSNMPPLGTGEEKE